MSVFSNTSKDAPELRAQYASAVLGLVGDRNAVDVLRDTPGAAARAVATLTPQKLMTPERDGKWSVAMVLRHLADTDVVWGWRMRLILAQDRPAITGFDQDLWAERLDYAHADPSESLETFAILRRDNLRLIERASADDFKRVGVHAERGEESAGYLVRLYAGHDLMHLAQIDRIKKTLQ
ncbi:MAG TPA: DinB family protein [Vicinamibacterales bacterium]|nr:DinB family protein [Vicinamibacterales bacterium]